MHWHIYEYLCITVHIQVCVAACCSTKWLKENAKYMTEGQVTVSWPWPRLSLAAVLQGRDLRLSRFPELPHFNYVRLHAL